MTRPCTNGRRGAYALAALIAAAFLILPAKALSFDGPLYYKNQHPLFMYIDTPTLTSARPQSSVSIATSYSSVYALHDTGSWAPSIDAEVFEAILKANMKLSDKAEVGLEIPVASLRSGYLDSPLGSYHGALHFGDYGRSMRPNNSFLYSLTRNGRTVVEGEANAFSLGDIRATFKKALYDAPFAVNNAPMMISISGSVELPTGNAKKGFGSGSTDAGAALLADIGLAPYLAAYVNIGAVAPGPFRAHETIKLKGYYFAGAALEASFTQSLSAIAQLQFTSDAFPKTGIGALDRGAAILTFGGRYDSGERSYELGFTEDPNTSCAPDFSATFTIKQKF